jgi:hypothetical protein
VPAAVELAVVLDAAATRGDNGIGHRPVRSRTVRPAELGLIREDFAVRNVGQCLADLVRVDGGEELAHLAGERRDLSATEERPQGLGIGEPEDQ